MNNVKPIKSFVLRSGRLTQRQKNALDASHYLLNHLSGKINWEKIFGCDIKKSSASPIILEIGFGMGKTLLESAKSHPDICFVGIEVYRSGVGALLAELHQQDIQNVRVFCADAVQVLNDCIADNSLQAIHIFFPDPWPKNRHHKRRLITAEFIKLIAPKLKVGGYLHLATDWEDYAKVMMKILSAAEDFANVAQEDKCISDGNGDGATSSDINISRLPTKDVCLARPLTKYEERGQRLGHQIWDLIFVKKSIIGVKIS